MAAEQPIPPGFLERATREAARYGDDPWILLRELVQNSRDAGATRIALAAGTREGLDGLSCTDDGRGMTRAEMRSYLLRLYASGKAPPRGQSSEERARGPVGRFGVGFWSVLRFSPVVVRVESRAREEGTAFEVDCVRGVLREVPCALSSQGTRVTLWRPTRGEPFVEVAEERLVHWAGAVRGMGGGPPPTLTFNGAVRNTPLAEPERIAERIRGRGFDGVLGFGRRPSVSLYAHGLLLREAGSLEELLPRRQVRTELGAPGLYPVVRVNADGLEVLMNRREVVEDELLESIVKTCERRLRKLRRKLLDRLAPLRLRDRLRIAAPRILASLAVVGLLGGAALAGSSLASLSTRGEPTDALLVAPPPSLPRSTTNLEISGGPRINQPSDGGSAPAWDLRVEAPEGLHLIRLTTLSLHDEREGLVTEPPVVRGEPAWGSPYEGSVTLEVGLPGAGASPPSLVRLAVPSGHGVLRGSVLVDGEPADVLGGADGEPLLRLSGGERLVRYRTGPSRGARPRPTQLVWPESWPAVVDDVLSRMAGFSPDERVRALESFVKEHVRYTNSVDDAARLESAEGTYVERVLRVGAGDCDVMNALFALLLRSAGIPAHVAVGLVASGGEVAPDLHAWTEYHLDGTWHALDVSPPLPVGSGGTPGSLHVHSSHSHSHVHGAAAAFDSARAVEGGAVPGTALRPAALDGNAHPPGETALSSMERRPFIALLLATLLVGAIAALTFTLAKRRTRKPSDEDDDALAELLSHWLQGSRSSDPLHLRLRPFFTALGERQRRSLSELERRAAKGLLFAAPPDDPLVPSLRRSALVLDGSRPAMARLLPLLPEALRLDALSAALARDRSAPLLHEVEATLRRLDDGVRVLSLPRAKGVHEVELPTKRPLAPRYLLVGEDDPEWRALVSAEVPHPTRAAAALRFLLERTTLYREQRRTLLASTGTRPDGSAP